MNTLDLNVLRVLARLSRMRKAVDLDSLALRVRSPSRLAEARRSACAEGDPAQVYGELRASLARLAQAGFVDRASDGDLRLTMCGLCLALAFMPEIKQERRAAAHRSKVAPKTAARRYAA
jgi:hypothetical protein